MQNYQIRLQRPEGTSTIFQGRYLGDFHAIRRAQTLADDDDNLEVWRDMDCIYHRETLARRMAS